MTKDVSQSYDEPGPELEVGDPTHPSDEPIADPTASDPVAADTPDADAPGSGDYTEPATEEVAVAPAVESAPADPLEEFRAALREKFGDWFVVHTYSGMENRVKANLESRISSLNMEDYIHEVVVPT